MTIFEVYEKLIQQGCEILKKCESNITVKPDVKKFKSVSLRKSKNTLILVVSKFKNFLSG